MPTSVPAGLRLAALLFSVALLGDLSLAQRTVYVDVTAAPGGNGTSASPFRSIQAGIDASEHGDLVLVLPGVYDENVAFEGRVITVRSRDGAGVTSIAPNTARAVRMDQGETVESVLQGFTLIGESAVGGGGLNVTNASGTIRDCIIEGCTTPRLGGGVAAVNATLNLIGCIVRNNVSQPPGGGRGGGIYFRFGTLTLVRCQVLDNQASSDLNAFGGGLYAESATVIITDSVIAGNLVGDPGGNTGGGIILLGTTNLTMRNSVVANNSALPGSAMTGIGGGVDVGPGGTAFLRHNVFWNNVAPSGPQLANYGTVDADFNVFEGGLAAISGLGTVTYGSDNIDSDPLFVNAAARDYHVSPLSPVVDAGGPAPLTGLDGDLDPRVLDGDGDGTAAIDIGWDELNPTTLDVTGSPTPGGLLTISTGGGPGQVFLALAGFQELDVPLPPYGALLVGGPVYRLGVGAVPGVTLVTIPMEPALLGRAVHFQSLARLIGGPPGAFSRRVSTRIR